MSYFFRLIYFTKRCCSDNGWFRSWSLNETLANRQTMSLDTYYGNMCAHCCKYKRITNQKILPYLDYSSKTKMSFRAIYAIRT